MMRFGALAAAALPVVLGSGLAEAGGRKFDRDWRRGPYVHRSCPPVTYSAPGYRFYGYGEPRRHVPVRAPEVCHEGRDYDRAWADLAYGKFDYAARSFARLASVNRLSPVPEVGVALAEGADRDIIRADFALRRAVRNDISLARHYTPVRAIEGFLIEQEACYSRVACNDREWFYLAFVRYLLGDARGALDAAHQAAHLGYRYRELDDFIAVLECELCADGGHGFHHGHRRK